MNRKDLDIAVKMQFPIMSRTYGAHKNWQQTVEINKDEYEAALRIIYSLLVAGDQGERAELLTPI